MKQFLHVKVARQLVCQQIQCKDSIRIKHIFIRVHQRNQQFVLSKKQSRSHQDSPINVLIYNESPQETIEWVGLTTFFVGLETRRISLYYQENLFQS